MKSKQLINLLNEKIDSVSFSGIKDDEALDIWSPAYFKDLIEKLQFENILGDNSKG